MAQHKFVVQIEGADMFLTGYNVGNPPESTFGNLSNAIEYDTLVDAQATASLIGSGTVGTTKPRQ